jgi:hypothetical protein
MGELRTGADDLVEASSQHFRGQEEGDDALLGRRLKGPGLGDGFLGAGGFGLHEGHSR